MYVLDTNVFYDLADSSIVSAATVGELQSRASDGRFQVAYAAISVIELVSRISDEPASFAQIKRGVQAVIDMSAVLLPDPEHRMAEIVGDTRLPPSMYAFWGDVVATIARAPDRDALLRGFDDYTTQTRRQVFADFMAGFRKEYEDSYIESLAGVVREINPRYEQQVRREKATTLPASELQALELFLQAPEWTAVVLELVEYRSKRVLAPEPAFRSVANRRLRYFREAYSGLMRKSFRDGARPTPKYKNDYNDTHLFLYIDDFGGDVLVSSDGGILDRIQPRPDLVISRGQFIDRVLA